MNTLAIALLLLTSPGATGGDASATPAAEPATSSPAAASVPTAPPNAAGATADAAPGPSATASTASAAEAAPTPREAATPASKGNKGLAMVAGASAAASAMFGAMVLNSMALAVLWWVPFVNLALFLAVPFTGAAAAGLAATLATSVVGKWRMPMLAAMLAALPGAFAAVLLQAALSTAGVVAVFAASLGLAAAGVAVPGQAVNALYSLAGLLSLAGLVAGLAAGAAGVAVVIAVLGRGMVGSESGVMLDKFTVPDPPAETSGQDTPADAPSPG